MYMLVWIGKVLRTAGLVKSIAVISIEHLSGGKDYKNVTNRDQEQNCFNRVHPYYSGYIAGKQFSYNEHFHRSK